MSSEDAMGREDKIILIGYRCTGKTSIGKRLAGRLALPFLDTDHLVEKKAGKSIRELVAEGGWAAFRKQEQEAIMTLTSLGKSVIATGGGSVMEGENAAILKEEGMLIWCRADAETIQQRMLADGATSDGRPPLSPHDLKREIEETLAERLPVYRGLADFTLDTGKTGIEESVEQILGFMKDKRGLEPLLR